MLVLVLFKHSAKTISQLYLPFHFKNVFPTSSTAVAEYLKIELKLQEVIFVFKLSAVCSHCSQTYLSHYLRETQAVHKVTKFSIKGKKDNFHFGRSFRLKTIFLPANGSLCRLLKLPSIKLKRCRDVRGKGSNSGGKCWMECDCD